MAGPGIKKKKKKQGRPLRWFILGKKQGKATKRQDVNTGFVLVLKKEETAKNQREKGCQ